MRTVFVMTLTILIAAAASVAAAETEATASANTALVVIDIQEFYFPGGALPLVQPEAAAANAARVLAAFRTKGMPVIHVRHNASSGGAIHQSVAPHDGETVISKDHANSFRDTELLEVLRKLGVTRLVICGMQTHMCVEAAARAAADLGFDCVVVADACATRALSFGDRTVAAGDVHASTLASLERTYARVVDTATLLDEL